MVAYYQLKGNSVKGFFLMLLFQQLQDLHNHWTNSTGKKTEKVVTSSNFTTLDWIYFFKGIVHINRTYYADGLAYLTYFDAYLFTGKMRALKS